MTRKSVWIIEHEYKATIKETIWVEGDTEEEAILAFENGHCNLDCTTDDIVPDVGPSKITRVYRDDEEN